MVIIIMVLPADLLAVLQRLQAQHQVVSCMDMRQVGKVAQALALLGEKDEKLLEAAWQRAAQLRGWNQQQQQQQRQLGDAVHVLWAHALLNLSDKAGAVQDALIQELFLLSSSSSSSGGGGGGWSDVSDYILRLIAYIYV
jgi:hypothetical protein